MKKDPRGWRAGRRDRIYEASALAAAAALLGGVWIWWQILARI